MALLLDTHILVWIAAGNERLPAAIGSAMLTSDLCVSAVTAWEYTDLEARGRFLGAGPFAPLRDRLSATLLDFPASAWELAAALPDIHRDPVDRMLIAHAIAADLTLVTADETMRRYPVKSLW